VIKLFKNVIKIKKIKKIKKKYTRFAKTYITLPLKNTYKTNIIRNNILNYYNKIKKDLIKLKLAVNN